MNIGLGLYRHMLTPENYRFAKQVGATHIVAHLTDYFSHDPALPTTTDAGWGEAGRYRELWTEACLLRLKGEINAEGLELAAIENFDPADWYDVLLAGPKRDEQLEHLKKIIRNLGAVGIPTMGYNFSIAGVWGWTRGPYARGGAESVGFIKKQVQETPIPNGMVWNMTYDQATDGGFLEPVSHEQLWERLDYFLSALVPVAEEAGVRLAAHPDDPPMPTLRGHARLVFQPYYYQKLLDLYPSKSNALEFCIGSLAEMEEGNIYEVVDHYSKQQAIGYIHFRNVQGRVPNYHEVFIDEGDVDMFEVIKILEQNGYDGVLIPDHTPHLTCDAPWHAGMAYAIGYMRAALQCVERLNREPKR